jgi:hypothetical protein
VCRTENARVAFVNGLCTPANASLSTETSPIGAQPAPTLNEVHLELASARRLFERGLANVELSLALGWVQVSTCPAWRVKVVYAPAMFRSRETRRGGVA